MSGPPLIQLDNFGIAKSVLAQSLREEGVSLNSDAPRHRPPDPTYVGDVNVLAPKLDIGRLINEDGRTRQIVHTHFPNSSTRQGSGAAILTCVNKPKAVFLRLFSIISDTRRTLVRLRQGFVTRHPKPAFSVNET